MKKYVILGVSVDEYELPQFVFNNYEEMAAKLNTSINNCKSIICRQYISKKLNVKFLKVAINEKEELEI